MPAAEWGEPLVEADGLRVWLRTPAELPAGAGAGSALFVHGAALHADRPIEALELAAGGPSRPAMATAMPSPGLAAELADPGAVSAILWGIVPLDPGPAPPALTLTARLDGGGLARLELPLTAAGPPTEPVAGSGAPIAIAMATFEPPEGLLERQLESLRAQTRDDWTCVISDDGSTDAAFARLERAIGGDRRFVVSRAPERRGAYANFARALAMVPAEAEYVALCDQDDRWHPDKLETLVGALGEARLAFADMRVVGADGAPISDTYWTSRRPNHESFASLLLGNSVTGAAALFRRELLDDALPLPPRAGNLYHDHWLALVAAATGGIAYVDRPLHDYVQHADAVVGHAGANRGVVGGGFARRLAGLRHRDSAELLVEWRRIYFAEYCRMALTAAALDRRLGGRLGGARRRAVERALAADRSPAALAWLAGRQLRRLRRDDTGGSEAGMLRGLAWRRSVRRRGGDADLPPGIVGPELSFPAERPA